MISLCLIATGKYKSFLPKILESAEVYFFPSHSVYVTIFTDELSHELQGVNRRFGIQQILIPSYKFPQATLYRYKIFSENANRIEGEYIFYSDVDMRFVSRIDSEILPTARQPLVVVKHPGFWRGGWGSPNTDPRSTAYLEPHQRKHYYCGGFNGGTREAFLQMSNQLAKNIQEDENNGVMAEYHDETHMNNYMSRQLPKVLTPSYCFPENWSLPFKKKIIALDKDHNEIRK